MDFIKKWISRNIKYNTPIKYISKKYKLRMHILYQLEMDYENGYITEKTFHDTIKIIDNRALKFESNPFYRQKYGMIKNALNGKISFVVHKKEEQFLKDICNL